jgi:sulfur-oxidizing protein SoxX
MTNEYGDIGESLTGMPGNVERGREVMSSRSLGNCIACHQVTDLEEYPVPRRSRAVARWCRRAVGRGGAAWYHRERQGGVPGNDHAVFLPGLRLHRPGNAFTGRAAEGPLDPLLSAQDIEDVVAYLMTLTEY